MDSGILDLESHETLNPHFRQIYLQFPYFTKELDECETLLERLFYALKNMEHWIRMPDALKEQVFASSISFGRRGESLSGESSRL